MIDNLSPKPSVIIPEDGNVFSLIFRCKRALLSESSVDAYKEFLWMMSTGHAKADYPACYEIASKYVNLVVSPVPKGNPS